MLSHMSFGVADLATAAGFYDAVLAALGYVRVWSGETAIGYGLPGGEDRLALFARADAAAAPGAGFHLALEAPSQAAVDAFHRRALSTGGCDGGPPGLREHYGTGYYAAFVFDPDGHKLEAVHKTR